MSTYAIGDVQGCYDQLIKLLAKFNFDPNKDTLWFVGDLINRGPKSLEVLRFVKGLGERSVTVLGNHDLTLLAISAGVIPPHKHDTVDQILKAPDADELINWLQHLPLFYQNKQLGYSMVHAGIPPQWDIIKTQKLANEVENLLQGTNYKDFLANMFGNEPNFWQETLSGWDRARFIVNALVRMRYYTKEGELDLTSKGPLGTQPANNIPWFKIKNHACKDEKIIFGHWASLEGVCDTPNFFALDTGCFWGNSLTALCLENKQRFKVSCNHDFKT